MSSVNNKLSYLIVEKNYLSTIFQPLKSSRIKYTCFDVSHNFLILGATSGGLYVFKREPCVFLQLVPNKEGSVNNISLSWDEKLIAFSTLKGVTCVLELLEGSEARLINRSLEHSGSLVTSLVWTKSTNQLYVGDNVGRLSVINVSLFMNKNIFHIPAYMFMKLDSAVVQISCFEDYLLVSTRTRCYICDTVKEKYKQIGTQLREGLYGATFLNSPDGLKIYCARPGSRLWEADISGSVKSTHQFKKALAVQSVAVIKLEENLLIQKWLPSWPDQSFNFCTLLSFSDKYLLTFKSDGVYVFDPTTAEVILWSDHYKDIVDAKCINDIVYLWTSLGQIYSFVVTPLNKCLIQLYFSGKYQLCVEVLEKFIEHAKSFSIMSTVTCLIGLRDHLPNINKNSKLSSYLENLILSVKEKQMSSKLDSGIFLVDNKHWKKWKLNIKNCRNVRKKKLLRSHSLSDLNNSSVETINISKREHSVTLSLPQMEFYVEPNPQNLNNQSYLESTVGWNVALSGSFMQQIPFLSLTSPDLIHSTILELGQNVKRKLSMSTKSLQNKWNIIEGKIKLPKESYALDSSDTEKKDVCHYKNIKNSIYDDDHIEKHIVYQPFNSDQKKQLSINASDICRICDKITNGDESDDIIFQFFDKIIDEMDKINQCTISDDNIKKAFPFKQFLSPKYVEIVKQIFSFSLNHHQIIKYLCRFKTRKFNFLDYQDHPNILNEFHKKDDLTNDVALSNMLLIFSEVVDPNYILDQIENFDMPCSFFSWSIILDIFQDNAFSFFATKKESPLNYYDCPLPFLLNMIFLMLRLEQIESSCHIALKSNLKLYHISYLIIKLCLHLEFTGIKYQNCFDKCNKLFLNFMLCLLNNGSLQLKELNDSETLNHIELAFLSVNKPLSFKCRCNYQITGSSKVSTKYPQIGHLLLSYYLIPFRNVNSPNWNYNSVEDRLKSNFPLFHNTTPNKNVIKLTNGLGPTELEFCFDFLNQDFKQCDKVNKNISAVYSKIIVLLQAMPELLSVIINHFLNKFSFSCLPFIVQFGIIEELLEADFKNSIDLWKQIFDLHIKLSHGECCICHFNSGNDIKLNWNKLFIMTLKCLGSIETVKLMISYADSLPSEAIDISFLRLFFLRPLIEEESESNLFLIDLCYEKLEPRKRGIFPQVLKHDDYFEVEEADDDINIHTIEIDLDNDHCYYCSLTLRSESFTQGKKIRLFHCNHVYHVTCLQKAKSYFNCPLCMRLNQNV